MSLGDYVRVVRTFVGGFAHENAPLSPAIEGDDSKEEVDVLRKDLKVRETHH